MRDELFRSHPQSPLPESSHADFTGIPCFAWDSSYRVTATVVDAIPERVRIGSSGDEPVVFNRFAQAEFELLGEARTLDLYWLEAYGGGLFVPFRDATSGTETYGGGRYLLDTVKGADLGVENGRLVLDFNFAFHPSCAHDPRWVCPLTPPANVLPVAVRAGERL